MGQDKGHPGGLSVDCSSGLAASLQPSHCCGLAEMGSQEPLQSWPACLCVLPAGASGTVNAHHCH